MYAYPHTIYVTVCTSTKASPVEFDPGCEAMIYTVDGTPLQGIPALLTKDCTEGPSTQALLAALMATEESTT